ncbi:hypothetical protein [Martelella mediterranea]|uniref:DUF4350 domain-containing protein n=1 Tax=Martelella mediterranea TaxID=293089 RepID=A0A4R3NJ68_9HYPH|nr:hypothetical protein [Martelella mediterranea]TCT34791.1 hypothetical protein EDC90_103035 [Martelella mediterranea]
MNERSPDGASGNSVPLIVLASVVIAGIALMFFSSSGRIERSAIGTDGLGIWLAEQGLGVEKKAPEEIVGEKTPILRILPLYDTDLTAGRQDIEEADADYPRATLRNLSLETFLAKIESADTLVVLPKWRSDMITSGTADPGVLIPQGQMTVFGYGRGSLITTAGDGFVQSAITGDQTGETFEGDAALYAPRVLRDSLEDVCEPILTLAGRGTLLARCADIWGEGLSFYLLSDPDLVNNHGLANGDNADLASRIISKLAEGRPVYIDTTTYANIADTSGLDPRQRSLADLRRFFEYPFSLFWIGIVIASGLALWRGSRRFGAPVGEAQILDVASKVRTIAASARLLRLSGSQDDLASAYLRARMVTLDDIVLGAARRPMSGDEVAAEILRRVRHRVPETGARLSDAYHQVAGPAAASQQRLAALIPFEKAFQETLDAFGHASRPS